MHSLNTTCNIVGRLNGFRGWVVYHENRHQDSLNKCIRAVNPRRLPYVEESTGSYDDVNRDLDGAWHQVVDDLLDAKETDQDGRYSDGKLWDHRWLGMWNHRIHQRRNPRRPGTAAR